MANPPMIDNVPMAIIVLIDSPPIDMASMVANNGDEPTMGADLETPAILTPVKFNKRPSGKFMNAESRNHRNATPASLRIASVWNTNASDIVIIVPTTSDTNVPVVALMS